MGGWRGTGRQGGVKVRAKTKTKETERPAHLEDKLGLVGQSLEDAPQEVIDRGRALLLELDDREGLRGRRSERRPSKLNLETVGSTRAAHPTERLPVEAEDAVVGERQHKRLEEKR